MVAHGKTEERMPASLSIQQIRAVEIVSIFFIVFIAREIGETNLRTGSSTKAQSTIAAGFTTMAVGDTGLTTRPGSMSFASSAT